jgi:hypothetical protein
MARRDPTVDLAYRMQRSEDIRVLREFAESLPHDHADRRGVIRAIEVLSATEIGVSG